MDCYKITNAEECKGKLNYHDGLVTDNLSFNPSGDCLSGGIYFTREDIFAFIEDECWIRKVEIPDGEEIYENPGNPKQWKAHRVFLYPRRKITLEVIKELVEEGASIHADNDLALVWSSKNGYLDIVEYLISKGANVHTNSDRCFNSNCALMLAAKNGHLEIVTLLVENGANVHAGGDWALLWASENNHLKVAKFLVKNGTYRQHIIKEALKRASENEHSEVVNFLQSFN